VSAKKWGFPANKLQSLLTLSERSNPNFLKIESPRAQNIPERHITKSGPEPTLLGTLHGSSDVFHSVRTPAGGCELLENRCQFCQHLIYNRGGNAF
jgi:hypothetical protein